MAIPSNDVIEPELLALLAASPSGRLGVTDVYDQLASLHPELTFEERSLPFKNSASQWANRVQFGRLHLVERGFIFRAGDGPNPRRGVWIITDTGREYTARRR